MPPKKKVERAATENISLGPQVREGRYQQTLPIDMIKALTYNYDR